MPTPLVTDPRLPPSWAPAQAQEFLFAVHHIREAKNLLAAHHSREASIVQTHLDTALLWLSAMLTVERDNKSIIFRSADPSIDPLDFLQPFFAVSNAPRP